MNKNVKVLVLCVLWYSISSLNSVIGKRILTSYNHPMTLCLCQLLSITTYSIPLLKYLRLDNKLSRGELKWILPLSCGKFLGVVTSYFSISLIPVSYAATVKATMPIFTVIITKVFLQEEYSPQVYLSLVPIILGVSIASFTEINFNAMGLLSALFSTFVICLRSIYSKRLLVNDSLHQFELLYLISKYSLYMYFPLYLVLDGNFECDAGTLGLLLLDGFLSFILSVVAFSFLKLVSALSYSVANASKRIFVIGTSLLVFKNEVTSVNVFGIVLAFSGVLWYSVAKGGKKGEGKAKAKFNNNREDLVVL